MRKQVGLLGRKGNRVWKQDQGAVNEVVGSALLVGLTVVVVSAFGLAATQAFSPVKRVNADLSPSLGPGADALWNTNDEVFELMHLGGADLTREATRIVLTVAGASTTLQGGGLGMAFDGGGFLIGETFTHTLLLASCDAVEIRIILDHGGEGTQLLLGETFVANEGACP